MCQYDIRNFFLGIYYNKNNMLFRCLENKAYIFLKLHFIKVNLDIINCNIIDA